MKYQRKSVNQEAVRSVEQFAPLIEKFTRKFATRAAAIGSYIDSDDIRQELALVFVRATRQYDETKAGSFMNFLIRAWYYEMNTVLRKDNRNRDSGITLQAESLVSSDEEVMGSLFDLIDSGWASPEQNMETHESVEAVRVRLSDGAKVVFDILVDPPDEVIGQMQAYTSGVKLRREVLKSRMRSHKEIDVRFLSALLNIPKPQAKKIQEEIEKVVSSVFEIEEVSKC